MMFHFIKQEKFMLFPTIQESFPASMIETNLVAPVTIRAASF